MPTASLPQGGEASWRLYQKLQSGLLLPLREKAISRGIAAAAHTSFAPFTISQTEYSEVVPQT